MDLETSPLYEDGICRRSIDHEAHAKIADETKIYLAKGKAIEIIEPEDWQINNKKHTAKSNAHLFRSKENAENS